MILKKIGKKVFGAKLTSDEQKAMDVEIYKELAEINRKNANEIDAIILWVLHKEFGFGPLRLKKYYDAFKKLFNELCNQYEMDFEGNAWVCSRNLKTIGVDIELWNKKSEEENKK